MKKKILCMLSLLLCLWLCISLAACGKSKHEAKSEWKYDEKVHWHECATKDHDDRMNVADHNFDSGVISVDPTETESGTKTFTCTVCGYKKTETIAKLSHTHTFDTANWESDESAHWHKATCEHSEEKDGYANHRWNDGVITKQATETTEGEKTYTCNDCGRTKTESIGTLSHTHTFDTANWESDETHHWHKATCEHTSEKESYAAHSFDAGVVTKAATETAEGEKTYTCSVCGYVARRTIPALTAKDNTVTVGTIDFTYNAKSQPIDSLVTAGNKAGMVIKYVGVDGTTYAESTTAPTNAGTYQYTITIPATAEWKAAEKTGKYTINKYELTVLYEKTHTTKEYDGSKTILVGYKSLEGTDVNIVIFMKSEDVGTEIDRIMLPDLLKDNYTYDQSKVTARITPKLLSGFSFAIAESQLIGTSGTQVITLTVPNTDGKVSVNISFDIATLTHEGTLTLITGTPGQGEAQIEFSTEEGDEYKNYAFASSGIGTLTLTIIVIGG